MASFFALVYKPVYVHFGYGSSLIDRWRTLLSIAVIGGKMDLFIFSPLFHHQPKPSNICNIASSSRLPKPHALSLQTGTIKVSPFAPEFWPSQKSIQSQGKLHKRRNLRIKAEVNGNSGVPTLTALPPTHINKPQKQRLAAIVGGIGAALLVVIIVVLVYTCLMRVKKFLRQRSETASSVPSPPGESSLQLFDTFPLANQILE